MELEDQHTPQILYYFTHFALFQPSDIQLLCHYKKFIEALIMQLGEDWRIESSLFTEEIITIRKNYPGTDTENFSLFNQFLSCFIRGRAYQEYSLTKGSEPETQEKFLEIVTQAFPQEEISESLTFKTLSLGFCITASQIWTKSFRSTTEKLRNTSNEFKPFSKLLFNDSSQPFSEPNTWKSFSIEEFGQSEYEKIKRSIDFMPHKLEKAEVYASLVCEVAQVKVPGKRIRSFGMCNQFYVGAFAMWLIFSIKMFFALPSKDYLKFCKDYMCKSWQERFQKPLEYFQKMLDKEWNKLLKDYTVALHDDFQVLKMLIERIKGQLQHQWESHLTMINPSMSE